MIVDKHRGAFVAVFVCLGFFKLGTEGLRRGLTSFPFHSSEIANLRTITKCGETSVSSVQPS